MTDYVDSHPTARKRHLCSVCRRSILPGEDYWRQTGLNRSEAWTLKTCAHCERVVGVHWEDSDWDIECFLERLEYAHPSVHAAMRAGWRWPDGELVPLPFWSVCVECGVRIGWRALWCGSCDVVRLARLDRQFAELFGSSEKETRS